jgi:uroporphyrinogen-III synthase
MAGQPLAGVRVVVTRARDQAGVLCAKLTALGAEVIEFPVAAFSSEDLAGKRILLPRAAIARDVVPVELAARGAQVDVVEAYRTVVPETAPALAEQIFAGARKPDWITFTSSSTVTNFVAAAGAASLDGVRVASIGPVTTATARQHGIQVTVEASKFTIDGLIEAILKQRGRVNS